MQESVTEIAVPKIKEEKPIDGPQVVLIFRKKLPNVHSIEYLFHTIYQVLKSRIGIEEYELPQYSTGVAKRLSNTFALLKFRKKLIHITGDCYYAILGAWFNKRIITIHDLSFLNRTSGLARIVLKLFWVTLPVKLSHKITVVSQATKQDLIKNTGVSPQKVHVIYNFIDPIYQPVERTFKATGLRILQVGTDFNKNIERLAKALEGLRCTLVIIGQLSEAQTAALSLSKIEYINRYRLSLDELHKEYLKADMLSFVSTIEGFGMPILEAQACGLPVVTSNCSAMPEVAQDGAVFVDPNDVQSIREGILEIVNDSEKRKAIVQAGYINVKRFSKEKIASDYLKLYQSLS